MTQEEKSILIKDLSARLPYEVKIETQTVPRKLFPMDLVCDELPRPYLRPLSSMTREERQYLLKYGSVGTDENDEVFDVYPFGMEMNIAVVDFLNAHHFDYRGLIEKGLALEAPEGMYKMD